MEPAEILKKPYARMIFRSDDGTYSAEIVEFPGCFAIGASASEALSRLDETAVDWIRTTIRQGQDIPEPMETTDYSGRLVLRLPRSLHQRCALYADRDGVSLNQFIVTALAERVGTRAFQASFRASAFPTVATIHVQISAGTGIPQPLLRKQVASSYGQAIEAPFNFSEAAYA